MNAIFGFAWAVAEEGFMAISRWKWVFFRLILQKIGGSLALT